MQVKNFKLYVEENETQISLVRHANNNLRKIISTSGSFTSVLDIITEISKAIKDVDIYILDDSNSKFNGRIIDEIGKKSFNIGRGSEDSKKFIPYPGLKIKFRMGNS